jgi:hypothetical protein
MWNIYHAIVHAETPLDLTCILHYLNLGLGNLTCLECDTNMVIV